VIGIVIFFLIIVPSSIPFTPVLYFIFCSLTSSSKNTVTTPLFMEKDPEPVSCQLSREDSPVLSYVTDPLGVRTRVSTNFSIEPGLTNSKEYNDTYHSE